MLCDTSPEAEKVRIELIRKMSVAQRVAQTRSLTAWAIRVSRRAIARANPHFTPREVELMWVELHYGKELAAGYREYLSQR